MGIKGLHKALSFCTVKDNLKHYQGRRLAIDASAWLHRSVYSVAEELAEAGHTIDRKCLRVSCKYMVARCLEMLDGFGIHSVYLVTDGQRSPMKADESQDRDERQRHNLEEARSLKRAGHRARAEEKYKACIRIRDNFAKEVIAMVRREFKTNGRRVFIVEAPFEADAQLCKLLIDRVADAVVTEDSDVLAYSAATHVAFPILYKLDRRTGDCDRISMDWLLSAKPPDQHSDMQQSKSNSSIESILQRFAVRQTKRPGFGVRLFVQACVLAGCDYSINKLDGVGLINAFKLVRDNAFRNDNVRFRKILESLPRKVKQALDIDAYEETLAKSEAVFFYHQVLYTNGEVKPLVSPRMAVEENMDKEHHFNDHFPYMARFNGDWSFLGVGVKKSSDASSSMFDQPLSSKNQKRPQAKENSSRVVNIVVQNPYLKPKRKNNENSRQSQWEKSQTLHAVQTNELDSSKQSHQGPLSQYLQPNRDFRFVKRKFPAKQVHRSPYFDRQQALSGGNPRIHGRDKLGNVKIEGVFLSAAFEYDNGDGDDSLSPSRESIQIDGKDIKLSGSDALMGLESNTAAYYSFPRTKSGSESKLESQRDGDNSTALSNPVDAESQEPTCSDTNSNFDSEKEQNSWNVADSNASGASNNVDTRGRQQQVGQSSSQFLDSVETTCDDVDDMASYPQEFSIWKPLSDDLEDSNPVDLDSIRDQDEKVIHIDDDIAAEPPLPTDVDVTDTKRSRHSVETKAAKADPRRVSFESMPTTPEERRVSNAAGVDWEEVPSPGDDDLDDISSGERSPSPKSSFVGEILGSKRTKSRGGPLAIAFQRQSQFFNQFATGPSPGTASPFSRASPSGRHVEKTKKRRTTTKVATPTSRKRRKEGDMQSALFQSYFQSAPNRLSQPRFSQLNIDTNQSEGELVGKCILHSMF